MMNIDDKIKVINNNINGNLEKLADNRGFLSQNILSQLRNFLEEFYLNRKYLKHGKAIHTDQKTIVRKILLTH